MNLDGLALIICEAPLATEIPNRIKVVPWGIVETDKGTFEVDDVAARQIVSNFKAEGADLVVDYEHGTLNPGRSRRGSIAAGWIKSLNVASGDGVYGDVEWTPNGRIALASKEYRHLSPVVFARKNGGRAVYLHSVGLTNSPAITKDLPAVVCSLNPSIRGGPSPESLTAFRWRGDLAASADGLGSNNDRRAIIAEAGRAYDEARDVHRLGGREEFISESLVIAGLAPLSDGERSTSRVPDTNRTELIREIGKQWDAEPIAKKLCPDRGHYIDGTLTSAGLPPMTEVERSIR